MAGGATAAEPTVAEFAERPGTGRGAGGARKFGLHARSLLRFRAGRRKPRVAEQAGCRGRSVSWQIQARLVRRHLDWPPARTRVRRSHGERREGPTRARGFGECMHARGMGVTGGDHSPSRRCGLQRFSLQRDERAANSPCTTIPRISKSSDGWSSAPFAEWRPRSTSPFLLFPDHSRWEWPLTTDISCAS